MIEGVHSWIPLFVVQRAPIVHVSDVPWEFDAAETAENAVDVRTLRPPLYAVGDEAADKARVGHRGDEDDGLE